MKMTESPNQTLQLSHQYAASAEHVYDAWLNPEVIKHWMFSDIPGRITNVELDEKRGGAFSIRERKDEGEVNHTGHYTQLTRPESLAFTLTTALQFEDVNEIEVRVDAMGPNCTLTLTQKNIGNPQTADAWKNMLVSLEEVLKKPYRITEDSDKSDLLTAIDVIMMQMVGLLRPLDDEQINTVPYANSWTAAQVIRHIIKSLEGLPKLMGKPAHAADRDPKQRIMDLKQTFLDITHTMTSPDFIVPETAVYQKESLLKELNRILADLKKPVMERDMSEIITDMPLGPVTKLELLHFVLYHAQRHLIQMKRITASEMLAVRRMQSIG